MVGSADMTNRRALEPTMSMSLFKSPEYAKEVFTWLDKHGDTPVSRENFKHLVSICMVKSVKVPSVQRKSADTSVLDTETARAQEAGHKLKHQSSMRFVPAAPARPASAASARRRHAVGHRPSTASAGLLRGSSAYESAHSSSQPVVSASTFLPVSKQALVKKAELARPLSRTRPPLPSSDIFLPRKPAKAALESKAGCADSDGSFGPAKCGTGPAVLLPVQSAGPAYVADDQPADSAQCCSSRAVTDAPSAEAPAQKAGAKDNGIHSTAQLSLLAADLHPDASVSGCCMGTTAEPTAAGQQQEQPCSAQAGRQPPKHAAMQKQNSRPSTAGSKQNGTSPFDRRLALLHKGLPTHVPVPDPCRPPSRARRLSTQQTLLCAPPDLSQSACTLPCISSAVEANAAAADIPLQAASSSSDQAAEASCSQDHSTGACTGGPPRKPGSTEPATEGPAAADGADLHDKGTVLILSKPSSPTSVLPSAGLGDTTYNSFHGLADAYPELYKQAAAAGRAHKSNSRALQSVVCETLKGNPDLWKQQLKSAYAACNDRLKQDAGWGRMDGVWDGPFLEWVGRSQLYSADLLSPDAAKDLEQWMQCAAPADKRHMMALLRDLHATVAPTGPRWQSVSHSTHTRQVPFGDGKELDKDLQRGTRPGTPASGTVTHKDQSATLADDKGPVGQTQAETAALHEPAAPQVQSVSRPRGINVNAVASKGTFRSSINLSQGAPATVKSTYGATHGASMPQLMAAVQTVAQQHAEAQKPVQVTCPFGSLDPLMDRAHLAVFPVPAGLLQGTTELHTDAQRSGLDETRYGQSFCSNAFKGDAAAILAAAQREKESSKAAGCRVTIPLGKKAVNCVPLYDTTYHDEFKARSVDVIQQRASAELMRSLNHAPTATVGCVTRSH
ncbi:TPA: hypothetical protein ACH3X2_005129 [Trebouxia sp. C0005]